MKRIALLLMVASTMVGISWQDLFARGGGGGGGARPSGGGGVSRPSPSVSHSPSLSGGARPNPSINRPSPGGAPGAGGVSRPSTGAIGAGGPGAARPGAGYATGGAGRPTAGQLNNFLDVPRPSSGAVGAGGAARPDAGGAAADFFRDGGAAGNTAAATQRSAAGTRSGAENRQNFADNRPSRVENRQELQQDRVERRDEVRNQVKENNPRLDFWSDHQDWAAWRINHPYRWATWGALAGWVGYGAGSATSYDYGSDVYYQDDAVYSGDQQVATADEYAQQADAIAESAPDTKPEDSEWLPLGVFAVTQDGQKSGSEPTLFMQLAVSKEGIISGTLSNEATKETQTLEGMIDKASQRAAWGVKGKQRPIMETGIGNLTQDTAPALVHFADGQTQQCLLVRLEEPKQP